MDKKRLILVLVLIGHIILIGLLLKFLFPSLLQKILDMHKGM